MDEQKDTLGMLDLILRPGFTVENQRIVKVNQAAQGYFLSEGMEDGCHSRQRHRSYHAGV